jgi:hypothetical protein
VPATGILRGRDVAPGRHVNFLTCSPPSDPLNERDSDAAGMEPDYSMADLN